VEWLSGLWQSGLSWIGELINSATGALVSALQGVGQVFSQTLGQYLQVFAGWLGNLLAPIWDLIQGLVYLIGKAIDVIILVIQALLLLGQVVLAVGGGLLRTIGSLASFNPATVAAVPQGKYVTGIGLFTGLWGAVGGDVIAQIVNWAIWLAAAWTVMRLIRRG